MKKKFLTVCLVFLSLATQLFASPCIKMRVLGDSIHGYYVNIYYGEELIADQSTVGELDLYFENEDYSVRQDLQGWKATDVIQSTDEVILSGKVYLSKLEADLSINIIYQIISKSVVSKRIEIRQNNLSLLFYSLSSKLHSATKPTRFWSFDDSNNEGGVVHETYPAVGYMLHDNLAIGLLTDAGNRNLWTRNIRRRPSKQGEIGFRAIREICDANMTQIVNTEERRKGIYEVKFTFGEVSDFNHPLTTVQYDMPKVEFWKPYNGGIAQIKGETIKYVFITIEQPKLIRNIRV